MTKQSDILVGNNGNVKIADYGLSTLYEDMRTLTSVVLVGWTAPELFNGAVHSQKTAAFSFGVIMYEVSFYLFYTFE